MPESATGGAGIESANTAAPQAESPTADESATDSTPACHADEIVRRYRDESVSHRAGARVVDLPVLDPVEPARSQSLRSGQRGEVGHDVGNRIEHQLDGETCEVGPETVVGAGAAETQVRIGISQHIERERVVEYVFVEVRRSVEQRNPLALLDRDVAELDIAKRGALKSRDRRCPADDLVDGSRRASFLERLPLFRVVEERH